MYERIDDHEQWLRSYFTQLPRPQDLPDLPEDNPLHREWKTYKREVGRLLAAGQTGRFALVKGDAIVSNWDTRNDATQAGRERFGQEMLMVQEIQPIIRPLRTGY
jgi:hypothetical protein